MQPIYSAVAYIAAGLLTRGECLDKEENGEEARPKYDQHKRLSKSNSAKGPAYSNMRMCLLVLDPIVVFRRIN